MDQKHFYIIGAGFAGRAIASDLLHHKTGSIIAFLDDDKEKIGTLLSGAPVLGPIQPILPTLDKNASVLLAIPSLHNHQLFQLYQYVQQAGFKEILILPTLSQLLSPKGSLALTREVDASDFLGRDPIVLNMQSTLSYIRDKRVLVTGAGGSIGSELARQLLIGGASRLYLFGHGENSIYQIEKELKKLQEQGIGSDAVIVPVIGEMQDKEYMRFLLKRLNADVIFHCAAHKHVPLMEANPVEAIKNNVFGVHNIIEAAKEAGVKRFALISTDKAVDPHNVYGCSKTLGEKLVMQAHEQGYPFFVVRFGNVLGSRGSIIPLFKEQISHGGPLTVTHPQMRRFFMTIPEAVSLVLLAGSAGSKTGLYLLDMGESIRIIDLAKQVASVYGFDVDKGDIAIEIVGIRPGEQLDEKLYSDDEEAFATEHTRLLEIKQKKALSFNLDELVNNLYPICYFNKEKTELFRSKKALYIHLKQAFSTLEDKNNSDEY